MIFAYTLCGWVFFFFNFQKYPIPVDRALEASPITGLHMQVTIC